MRNKGLTNPMSTLNKEKISGLIEKMVKDLHACIMLSFEEMPILPSFWKSKELISILSISRGSLFFILLLKEILQF